MCACICDFFCVSLRHAKNAIDNPGADRKTSKQNSQRRNTPTPMTYDIFISYKHLGVSKNTASALYNLLIQKGYNVFLDRKELRSGNFNTQLLDHISSATDVIILLEEHSLDSWFSYFRREPLAVVEQEQSTLYKTDWFCQEVMHALSIEGKNIVPILLDGYEMPKQTDLPEELKSLSLKNALELEDLIRMDQLYEEDLLGKEYLYSKPKNLAISRQYKGGVVGQFLFYTDAASCELYERGERINTLTEYNDQHHPLCYPVPFAGEHRFLVVNNDTCEEQLICKRIEANNQEYIPVAWTETQNLWQLTEEMIAAEQDADRLARWGKGLFLGSATHQTDLGMAAACMERALDLSSEAAKTFLLEHDSVVSSPVGPARFRWALQAARCGSAVAQNHIGYWLYTGLGTEVDHTAAVRWFTEAAGSGYAKAQSNLGVMYRYGNGVEQNYEKALEYFLMAAEQGNERAQYILGDMYQSGAGMEPDYELAAEWYRKAAEQGFAAAQFKLGMLYLEGEGVSQDIPLSLEWIQKAADQGYVEAQLRLGTLYAQGHGVEKSQETALLWFRYAAEQGSDAAQSYLGWCYENGIGVERDPALAAEWYRKAAGQGFAPVLAKLGHMYLEGNGVERSPEQAEEWLKKAAEAAPDDASILEALSAAYEAQNRHGEALAQLQLCLKLQLSHHLPEESVRATEEKIAALERQMA